MTKTSLLLASMALTLSGSAQADQLEDIQKSGTLRVGITGDYKPFSYFDGKNYSGYEIDVAQHIAIRKLHTLREQLRCAGSRCGRQKLM